MGVWWHSQTQRRWLSTEIGKLELLSQGKAAQRFEPISLRPHKLSAEPLMRGKRIVTHGYHGLTSGES